jgi:LmbE family N-acetylglucosaminyl deacetylase
LTRPPPGGDAPLVVLSPHFDDAALSVGGTIAAARAAGRRVTVVTFFAGAPDAATVAPALAPFARYDVRRAEDDRALALLDAACERLAFVERAFRAPPLPTHGAVFHALPDDATRLPNLRAMIAAIAALRARHPGALLLAPLGVGNHVDHVELFLAAVENPSGVWFYEDAYALVRAARRRHFVTRRRPLLGAADRSTLRTFALGRALAWAMRGPTAGTLVAPSVRALDWHVEPVAIADWEERKLAAVRAYASQLTAFGGDGWLRALARQHRLWGGAEPLWSATAT